MMVGWLVGGALVLGNSEGRCMSVAMGVGKGKDYFQMRLAIDGS